MIRAYRFELLKLRRRSVAFAIAGVAALSLLATLLTFGLASSSGRPNDQGYVSTIPQLRGHEGLTAGFVDGMSLLGLLVFVVFLIATTSEFGGGTIRPILINQPRRISWAIGKVGALLTLLAVTITAAFVVALAGAVSMAPARGISMDAWFTGNGIGHAAAAWLAGLAGTGLYGIAGIALGLLARSTVVALAIGIAWTFPLEHIIQNAWSGATGVFPGLSFDAVARGGVPNASLTHAVLTALLYAAVGGGIALVALAKRDVTA
jgi:hypothetical protein